MDTAIYIVDASIVLKWVTQEGEENTSEAHTVLTDIDSGRITAKSPDLLYVEFANVLYTSKKYSEAKIIHALNTLARLPIQIVSISPDLLLSAINISTHFEQTVYDGLYLALAKKENAKVITADKQLIKVNHLTLPLAKYGVNK